MQALVLVVGYAIAIFISLLGALLAAKAPNKRSSTSIKRSRRVVVGGDLVVFANILDLVILAVSHFFVAIEGEVPKSANGHIKTHSKVYVPGQMETQTGGQQHGVNQRAAGVTGLFHTEFTGEFHKGIHKVKGHYINTRGINHSHRQVVINRIDYATVSIPTDRNTHGGKVQGEDQVSTDTKGIAGKGVGLASAVQVPSMAGAHTGSLFARRYVCIHLDGSGKEPLVAIKGYADLEPHVQVTAASGPHVVGARGTVRFSMFVVERQVHAQVHEIIKANGCIYVAREGGIPIVKPVGLAIGGIVTATAQGPSVNGDVSARTDRETKLTVGLGIVLVDTVSAPLDASLSKSKTTGKERQTYYFFHKISP